jgi:hypothetical protein
MSETDAGLLRAIELLRTRRNRAIDMHEEIRYELGTQEPVQNLKIAITVLEQAIKALEREYDKG